MKNKKERAEEILEEESPEAVETTEDPTDSPDSESVAQDALAQERDKFLRLAAEYENFRRRSQKERESAYSDARADTIIRLLPVYDNLERALKMECADEAFYTGVKMTFSQLTEIMTSMGVEAIPALGETFDPNRHNAVMSIENPDLGEKEIADELQKGFTLNDKVIRFSTVVVAN
ncbi:MAG: nucleotide exchange factor GrpE [Oscillospiraceae bacterium]|nr:nucleotide exchange factor GrpE [Oscillospiraceae bacterium]